jgi:beta-lactamase class A
MAGDAEIAALKAVLAPGPVDVALFNAAFLKAVPAAQIEAGVGPLKTLIGPVVSVEPRGGMSYAVETASHEMLADISLDADGKIGGLLFHAPLDKISGIEDLLKQIGTIAPQSAYLVLKDGKSVYAGNADTPLAVGSAFKLGVLKALRDEIDAGTRKWPDVVMLEAGDISLPSGTLQTWPVGSPLTLHTLAALMISISDNTAADLLLRIVGRDKVEAALGIAPVLTTRELFTLKANPALKAKYQAGDLAAKRAVLAEADLLPLPDGAKVGTPHDAAVEYDLSASKLCALIEAVGDLDVTQINPGVASKPDWTTLSFKGGSEIGVLSFVTLAVRADGARYCVSAIWNGDKAIDESAAAAAYAGVLGKLARGG